MNPLRALSAALLLLALGCAGADRLAGIPPDELYRMAVAAGEDKDYTDAAEILDRIRDDHPFSRYAVEAELLAADLKFQQEKFEEAAALYRAFEELHPTYARIDYVIFRRGLSHWEMAEYPGRDQTATRDAAEAFQKLLYGYPNAAHAERAREQLAKVRARLAAHEVHVGRYYMRRKSYAAALHRLEGVVREFPDTPSHDQALELALVAKSKLEKIEQNSE